ncbi:hypothetical protein GCM10027071_30150 [Microbacterium marinum]
MIAGECDDRSTALVDFASERGDEQQGCPGIDGDVHVEARGGGVENAGFHVVSMAEDEGRQRTPLARDPFDELGRGRRV